VQRVLRDGGRAVFTGRDAALGAEVQERLGDAAGFVAADASDAADVERSVAAALDVLGGLDLLVNNAGIAFTERLVDTPVDAFDRLMAVDVRGCFLYARACFPALVESRGSMVHIASDAGLRGEQPIGAYSVAKAAVVMMSRVLAMDGAAHGVRSNCVCPGTTAPGMRHGGPADDPDRPSDPAEWPLAPLGRVGRGEDVASAVAYLASPAAEWVTGAELLVDGGMGAGLYQ
jgi:NAD(P)-dependent dehydrogenase (short-subunit alcohol dehydrogenase family)